MKAADESVAPSDTAPVQNPAAVSFISTAPQHAPGTRLRSRNLH